MTDVEIAQATALSLCRFSPASSAKRFVGWAAGLPNDRELTPQATAFLDNLAHQYRKQIGKCLSVACEACNPRVDPDEARVALDAFLEGRDVASLLDRVPPWRKIALARYNTTHSTKHAHPYEYATRCAPESRRAKTLGDVFCRFCGERLFAQVKQPHDLVKSSAEAQRHLTICALQILAGMRAPAKPGDRRVPMEMLWNGEAFAPEMPRAPDGPLFAKETK